MNNNCSEKSIETVTVFFSWQSDIPELRSYLTERLISVIKELEKAYPDKKLILDMDTRNCSGSQDIHKVVFKKIYNCSIFIADVSITNVTSIEKKLPNSNVMIELGFAIRSVGWDRIIQLFDEETWKPEQLPFDIRSHEDLVFSRTKNINKKEITDFENKLKEKLKKIIDENPPRFCEYGYSVEELRRMNDISTIEVFLRSIPIASIDAFIQDMPYKFNKKVLGIFEEFEYSFKSNSFYLFDGKIKRIFNKFYESWNKCLSYGRCFVFNTKTNYFIFTDNPYDPYQDSDNEELTENIRIFQKSFKKLLEEIRINWPEVSLLI